MSTAIPVIPAWISGSTGPESSLTTPVHNPATGEVIALVAHTSSAEIDQAIHQAAIAQREWGERSVSKRSAVMYSFRELLSTHAEELAQIISREHGKVLADAHGEIARGMEVVEFATGIPQLLKGEYSDQAASGIDVFSYRQPLGVVVGVTPFNFPAMIPLWMIPLALATGNSFILKPPTRNPSAALFIAELWQRAGLPDGVLQVVHGDQDVVTQLITHPQVSAVSFVGSTPTARAIYRTATAHGKRCQALGGAKNHGLVLSDARLDDAADHLIAAAFGAAGERCMALPVAVVEESVADALVAALADRARQITVSVGTDPQADMGPVISAEARERIIQAVSQAQDDGARIVVDGRECRVPEFSAGYFLGPTILDGVTRQMAINNHEVFGPVLEIMRVASLSEGIELINTSPFGNGAAIFTSSGESARKFHREIKAGMVGVNVPIPVPVAWHSFGGWKDSLFGDVHMYGPDGVRFFTRPKMVTQRWPQVDNSASFHFSGDSQK